MPQNATEYECAVDCEGFPCFAAKYDPDEETNDSSNMERNQLPNGHPQPTEESSKLPANGEKETYSVLHDPSFGHLEVSFAARAFQNPTQKCKHHKPVIFCHSNPNDLNLCSFPVNTEVTDNQDYHSHAFRSWTEVDTGFVARRIKKRSQQLSGSKMPFKVPKTYFSEKDENVKESNFDKDHLFQFHPLKINIWDEFYYGASILDKASLRTTAYPCFFTKLGKLFPKQILDKVVFSAYIALFFFTCVIFNHVGKLACYCVMRNHLFIHEKAYNRCLKIQFSENVFQGPYNVFLRFLWCAHCCQSINEKITLKLMKEYRDEITGLS